MGQQEKKQGRRRQKKRLREQKLECYESYPLRTVFISNLLSISICAIGFYILLQIGLIFSLIYLLYFIFLEIRVMKKSCTKCYYYGKCCAFGMGKLARLFFKKEKRKLAERKICWKDLFPDLLLSLIPIVAGIVVLIIHFSWIILLLIFLLIVFSSFGNGFVRGKLACRHCKQKELGCPAEKLFDKNKK